MDIGGHTLLWHSINNAKKGFDKVIVATPDSQIAGLAESYGVNSFIGDEKDVLDRYYQAAVAFEAEHIARLTADNPMIPPSIMRRATEFYCCGDYDYIDTKKFPTGVRVEIFSMEALELAWNGAETDYEREHVTPYMYNYPEIFRVGYLENDVDLSHMQWSVDTVEELEGVRFIYSYMKEVGQ